jgi:polyisoprenoid-binding protein YceI
MQKKEKPLFRRGVALLVGVVVLTIVAACGPLMDTSPLSTPTSAPATQPPIPTATTAAPAATTVPATSPATAAPTNRPTTIATTAPTGSATSAATASAGGGETVRLTIVSGDTEARYRVREQLARVNFPSDAVGATKSVTGTIVAKTDGTIDTAQSRIQVDLSTLKSDEGQRDNFIKQGTLQTRTYPYAVFVPTKIEGLALPPKDGDVTFKLTGNMTIRNVTKPVTWDVKGTIKGNDATGTATTSFTFGYFNLERPNVFTVLSIEDNIKLEMDLHIRRVTQ